MYIEDKSESLNGRARIGRVTFSRTMATVHYSGRAFHRVQGYKFNYRDNETREPFWISGPRKDGADRLYVSHLPVDIDEDAREEYWLKIRKRPELIKQKHT